LARKCINLYSNIFKKISTFANLLKPQKMPCRPGGYKKQKPAISLIASFLVVNYE